MSKSRTKKHKTPSRVCPRAVTLRPRLSALWQDSSLLQQDDETLAEALDAVVEGTDAPFFLRTMLKAYAEASPEMQARLDRVLPDWLPSRGYLEELAQVVSEGSLDEPGRNLARRWLAEAGVGTNSLAITSRAETFYQAYYYGSPFQGALILLWYANRQRSRVQGLTFLLDFNPPWEGAVKDVLLFPQRDPLTLLRDFVRRMVPPEIPLEEISAEEAAAKLLAALESNRREGIRLPIDLTANREVFEKHVLPILNKAKGVGFTMEDFDHLSSTGQSPESTSESERRFGGRTRLPDGSELRIMYPPDDE